jgi:hypothetical protein
MVLHDRVQRRPPYFLREEALEACEPKQGQRPDRDIQDLAEFLGTELQPVRLYAALEAFRRHIRGD